MMKNEGAIEVTCVPRSDLTGEHEIVVEETF